MNLKMQLTNFVDKFLSKIKKVLWAKWIWHQLTHWSSWRKKFEGHLFYISCWKSWRCDHCFNMEKVFFFFKAILSSCNTVFCRFSQLQALHKHLSTVHKQLYLHGNFPPLLETSFFNRQGFPSKPAIIFSPRKQPEVVEIRRAWILELLEFLARYECCRNVEIMMVSVQPATPK